MTRRGSGAGRPRGDRAQPAPGRAAGQTTHEAADLPGASPKQSPETGELAGSTQAPPAASRTPRLAPAPTSPAACRPSQRPASAARSDSLLAGDGAPGSSLDGALEAFRDRLDLERRLRPFAALRRRAVSGASPGAERRTAGTRTLHLDDVSAIPFLDGVRGVEHYAHRARLRARDGDLHAAVTPVAPGYERYCRDVLGLGAVDFAQVEPAADRLALAQACQRDAGLVARLATIARHGALVIEPFLGAEAVWELAAAVAAEAGGSDVARVFVLAPPPPVTWVANDKACFEDLVTTVLGPDCLPASRRAASAEALASALLELARGGHAVALKRLRCASAMGNEVFDGAAVRCGGRSAALDLVGSFLARTGWDGKEEVLAVRWERASSSPSTQWWVPPQGSGEPVLDGIYEQILAGEEGVFVGSRPSSLGAELDSRLVAQARPVTVALQHLGYVGRCSFDHLVLEDGRVVFTECNGRWGGTSTPMRLMDRLFPQGRPPYEARSFAHPDLVGLDFPELLVRLGDSVHDRGLGAGRFVVYNVGPLAEYGKFDVVAVGGSRAHVEELMTAELPRRLGVG